MLYLAHHCKHSLCQIPNLEQLSIKNCYTVDRLMWTRLPVYHVKAIEQNSFIPATKYLLDHNIWDWAQVSALFNFATQKTSWYLKFYSFLQHDVSYLSSEISCPQTNYTDINTVGHTSFFNVEMNSGMMAPASNSSYSGGQSWRIINSKPAWTA